MARRKNRPEAVEEKNLLSERLREIRVELFGERGGSEMARRLGLPVRTWYNYESGVTVPAEILLRFVELTAVEPSWLLHGRGPRFRTEPVLTSAPGDMVRDLLRIALNKLERREGLGDDGPHHKDVVAIPYQPSRGSSPEHPDDVVLVRVEPSNEDPTTRAEDDVRYLAAPRDWLDSAAHVTCVRVNDDSMAPVLHEGGFVAFSHAQPEFANLAGNLVVAWVEGGPVVRWFDPAGQGKYALLRAENPRARLASILVDLDAPSTIPRIRRVLWTTTPH